ncbi:structure-specific endonuclease subunit SLX1, partial [Striga asiatica]
MPSARLKALRATTKRTDVSVQLQVVPLGRHFLHLLVRCSLVRLVHYRSALFSVQFSLILSVAVISSSSHGPTSSLSQDQRYFAPRTTLGSQPGLKNSNEVNMDINMPDASNLMVEMMEMGMMIFLVMVMPILDLEELVEITMIRSS